MTHAPTPPTTPPATLGRDDQDAWAAGLSREETVSRALEIIHTSSGHPGRDEEATLEAIRRVANTALCKGVQP